jgi:hypothetical protein
VARKDLTGKDHYAGLFFFRARRVAGRERIWGQEAASVTGRESSLSGRKK